MKYNQIVKFIHLLRVFISIQLLIKVAWGVRPPPRHLLRLSTLTTLKTLFTFDLDLDFVRKRLSSFNSSFFFGGAIFFTSAAFKQRCQKGQLKFLIHLVYKFF
jgi:hypothetical protein